MAYLGPDLYYPLSLKKEYSIKNKRIAHLKYKMRMNPKYSTDNFNRCLDLPENPEIRKVDLITAQCFRNLSSFQQNCSHKNDALVKAPEKFVFKQLYEIIPNIYFGSHKNRNKFFKIVRRILSQSHGEFVHKTFLIDGFNLNAIPWLNEYPDSEKPRMLMKKNIFLLQAIVKPLINYLWYFQKDVRSKEVSLVPRWQTSRFCDKNFQFAKKCLLELVDSMDKKVLGKLLFTKKGPGEFDYRPILWQDFRGKDPRLKEKLFAVIATYQTGAENKMYKKWVNFLDWNFDRMKSNGKKDFKVYGVKLDLVDAFGRVELDKLKDLITVINPKLLTQNDKLKLIKIIDEQYVTVRGKDLYCWKKGLLQGAKLSPLLCHLYLSHGLYEIFKKFDRPHAFLERKADDIFFVSPDLKEVEDFHLLVGSAFLLNEKKTHSYKVPFLGKTLAPPEVLFCGKIFNLCTLQTECAFEGRNGEVVNVRKKFKIWDVDKQFDCDETKTFLRDFMQFKYVNNYFTPFELNTKYNSTDTVIKNIFNGMIFAAFRMFCGAESRSYLFKKPEDTLVIFDVIKEVIHLYSGKIMGFIHANKGESFPHYLHTRMVRFISYHGFLLVFNKYSRYHLVVRCMLKEKKGLNLRGIPWKQDQNESTVINKQDSKYFRKMPECFRNFDPKRNCIFKSWY